VRSIWSGGISFGLIYIPVKLYTAVRERGLDFDMLRKRDLCPIKYVRVCRNTGEEVPYKEIVKGYEYRKGDYIVLQDEDFKRANVRKTQTIEIVSFADEHEIDPKYFEKPYYLGPIEESRGAYVLLREALRTSERVGVARFVLRTREHIGVLKAEGRVIVLEQLRYDSEVINPDGLDLPEEEISRKELDVAIKLIDQLTEHFRPDRYHDTYTEELKRVINEKARGKAPKAVGEAPKPTDIADLMTRLRESLERAQKKEPSLR
jgi:DNA end-binding protein Ku